jgi:hypothetical protein
VTKKRSERWETRNEPSAVRRVLREMGRKSGGGGVRLTIAAIMLLAAGVGDRKAQRIGVEESWRIARLVLEHRKLSADG